MGVWIETVDADIQSIERKVTPFVGVWIETQIKQKQYEAENASHPSWVCGLKLKIIEFIERRTQVTPFVGVWIETRQKNSVLKAVARHTLRGCVD